ALGPPQPDQAETAALAGRATPPPHPGGPDDTEGGPLGITHWPPEGDLGLPRGPSQEDQTAFEGLPKGHLGIPMIGVPQGNSGGHIVALSAQDLQDLQGLLAWWRDRHRLVQDAAAPERQMERQ